jgi:hypothetical protein
MGKSPRLISVLDIFVLGLTGDYRWIGSLWNQSIGSLIDIGSPIVVADL